MIKSLNALISSALLILTISSASLQASEVVDNYPFTNQQKEQQFYGLLKQIRCLVCQNQDISDSNADLAQDLRAQVYLMVQQQKTNDEVFTFLTERYGDFILFQPPVKETTYLLWYGPFLLLAIGLIIFIRSMRRHRRNQ